MTQPEIRYQDEHIAVVSKPSGLVVHPPSGKFVESLAGILGRTIELAQASGKDRPGIVHRLDKGTSGLLVVAKTDEALSALQIALKNRQIKREYLALVIGRFSLPTGRIEAPIRRSSANPTVMAVEPGGRDAATNFRVAEDLGWASLVEVHLDTGRTHQIRVHFAHIGHPVLGDNSYGRAATGQARDVGLQRPFLHSVRIAFDHPITGAPVEVTEDLPEELVTALDRARKLNAAP